MILSIIKEKVDQWLSKRLNKKLTAILLVRTIFTFVPMITLLILLDTLLPISTTELRNLEQNLITKCFRFIWFLVPSSCILLLVSYFLYPISCILGPVSYFLFPISCIPVPVSYSSCIPDSYPSSCILRSCILITVF